MANFSTLKAAINAVIKTNGQKEITGEVLNQVLNAMVTSLGSNYQFAGVATPSTNPGTPDQNVFYMATETGTYTNFNATVLPAGISILLWNGSWSHETFFEIDSVPTSGSDNLISSGAVFEKMKLDGGAYDVTTHNNNATFADLSALLNSENLNTLIPVDVRHGGMNIKFVQTSDNKYVQFRCISNEFTTDTTQWAISDEGVYAENPDYIDVLTDKDNKVLEATKTDGSKYLSGDLEVEGDIINQGIQHSENGKGLIDFVYASTKSSTYTMDYLNVVTDQDDKVLEGIRTDGIKEINSAVKIQGNAIQSLETKEFVRATVTKDNKILCGLKKDGDFFFGSGVPSQIQNEFNGLEDIYSKKYIVIEPELTWLSGNLITSDGSLYFPSSGSRVNGISNKIPVFKGDILMLDVYLYVAKSSILSPLNYCFDTPEFIDTYTGISYSPIDIGDYTQGVNHIEYTVVENGTIVLCAQVDNIGTFVNKLTIKRNIDGTVGEEIRINNALAEPFVRDLDFVPNLAKRRESNILTYSADTKASGDYMVNAVAYPNGVIIAARNNGNVVRVNLDGTEEILLTISGAHDWRGVFIDSNNNVYVSPHSTIGGVTDTHISQADRGLYRLAYGSNTFEKVIPLYISPEECGVTIKVYDRTSSFAVGDLVFEESSLYRCIEAHQKGDTFAEDKFELIDTPFAGNTTYSHGDIVIGNHNYFICKEAHTSAATFGLEEQMKWYPLTSCMENDDTIWTMCEDDKGHLYAGVYAHSYRRNPAVYKSTNGIIWNYRTNFTTNGSMPITESQMHTGNGARHVHCINFNEFNNTLYAAVGEVNTLCMSQDYGNTWINLDIPFYYGQPTHVIGVKDGTLVGSDGHYACGITKLMKDNKTRKNCGCTTPGFVFAMRRSDLTGWIYAFIRCDNVTGQTDKCPPVEAMTDPAALENWKTTATYQWVKYWESYNAWASKYYPADAIRPTHATILVSKDEGDTWEVIRYEEVNTNYASTCGFITTGYFRNGECLTGLLVSVPNTQNTSDFINPIVISEGKRKYSTIGYDLTGEIFIKTNTTNIINI